MFGQPKRRSTWPPTSAEAILTKTIIGKSKQHRPKLEAVPANGHAIELGIKEWSSVVAALCGPRGKNVATRRQLLKIGTSIAGQMAEALGIEPPADKE